jgi:aspartate beta-hydroxylase
MSRIYDAATALMRGFYRLGIRTPPVLDAEIYFPMALRFEERFGDIRREVLTLPGGVAGMPLIHEVLREQTDLFETDSIPWRFVPLHAFGRPHPANQALCPVTSGLLRDVPGLLNATFSVLEAGKHLTAHKGPYAGMMRYHLGLVVPPPAPGRPPSALRVEGRFLEWREGKGFLFDDSFEHEAWNNADEPRIVLIVDFSNPTMPAWLRLIDRVLRVLIRNLPFARRYLRDSTIRKPARSAGGFGPGVPGGIAPDPLS